jgi:hypothetical protein
MKKWDKETEKQWKAEQTNGNKESERNN